MTTLAYTESLTDNGTPPISRLRDSEVRKELASPSFNLFMKFCQRWELTVNQRQALLGDISRQTYHNWEKNSPSNLSRDQLERISIILGIHKGLNLLFSDFESAKRWFTSLNKDAPYCGKSPVSFMEQGGITDLYEVRKYIDAWRGVK